MLVLSRKINERIICGDEIVVTLIHAGRGVARLGFDAPASVSIDREEMRAAKLGGRLTDDEASLLAERLLDSTVSLEGVLPAIHPGVPTDAARRRLADLGVARCLSCRAWRRGGCDCQGLPHLARRWCSTLMELSEDVRSREAGETDAAAIDRLDAARKRIGQAVEALASLDRS